MTGAYRNDTVPYMSSEPVQYVSRGTARTEAIMAAVFQLLREVGYEALTIDAVATRACASKATIYRRWADKRALVCDVMLANSQRVGLGAEAISLRDDLLGLLRLMAGLATPADTPAFASLLAVAQRDDVIAQMLWEGVLEARRRECREVLQRAIRRGELPAAVENQVEELFELIIGQFLVRLLVSRRGFDIRDREMFVDTVLLPMLRVTVP